METTPVRVKPAPRPAWTYGLMLLVAVGALGLPVQLAVFGEDAGLDPDAGPGWAFAFWICAPALPVCLVSLVLRRWPWWDLAVYLAALPLLLALR